MNEDFKRGLIATMLKAFKDLLEAQPEGAEPDQYHDGYCEGVKKVALLSGLVTSDEIEEISNAARLDFEEEKEMITKLEQRGYIVEKPN